jgi:hypothetical protein
VVESDGNGSYMKVSIKDVYTELKDLKQKNDDAHDLIVARVDAFCSESKSDRTKIKGSVNLNMWIAGAALTVACWGVAQLWLHATVG